jgi:outer membrane protein, multidrug efflux system
MTRARAIDLRVLLFSTVVTTSGCMVHNVDEEPKAPVELPTSYDEPGAAGAWGRGRCWEDFGDPDLTVAVESALSQSLELRQAWARLKQAEAVAVQAAAGLYPTVDAQVGVSGQRRLGTNPLTGATESSTDALYSASLPVSYEIDVWGKVRSRKAAAEQDVLAFRDDVETVAMTLAANVAEQWFDVLEQRAARKLYTDQQKTNDIYLELIQLRFQQGQSIASDVYQQRQLVQGVAAQLPLTEAREAVAWQQLGILTGKRPREVQRTNRVNIPALPPLPAAGLPSELLQRRPDIRAARRRAVAADYRIGEAIANRYPSFRLNGAVGLQSTDISEIFADFVWNLGGSAAVSLFDGGLRAAEVDRTEAVLEERIATYGLLLQRRSSRWRALSSRSERPRRTSSC